MGSSSEWDVMSESVGRNVVRAPPPVPPKPKHLCKSPAAVSTPVGALKAPVRPAPPPPPPISSRLSCANADDASTTSSDASSASDLRRRPSAPCGLARAHPRLLRGHESLLSEVSSGVYSDSESSDLEDYETADHRSENLYRVAQEMCRTEQAYVSTLHALTTQFPAYISQLADAGQRVVTSPDVTGELARQLEALRELHLEIARQLKARLRCWSAQRQVTDILLKLGHFLKMSRMFLQQKSELAAAIVAVCRQYPEFANAVRAFELKHFNGLQLVHQLDCVHQRICRYPLLLSAYMKYLPEDSAEYPTAVEAKALLQNVALEIERGLLDGDNMRRMYEIQRRLQSDYEVIRPGRKLIKEGEILKHSRKEIQSRHLLLFNDVLLYCAPVASGSHVLRIRNELPLSTLDHPVLPTNDANSVEFHLRSQRRSVILIAKSTDERDQWVAAICDAINCLGNDTFEKSYVTMNCCAEEIGRKAPPWVPDDRVTMCQHCTSQFTTIRRRHHCRGCGKVICRRCIGKAPLEYADFAVQIVCPDCYDILLGRIDEEAAAPRFATNCTISSGSDCSKMTSFSAPRTKAYDQAAALQITNRSDENLIKQDNVWLRQNRRAWKKYWCLLRKDALIEFYAACEDNIPKMKFVLLSYQLQRVIGVDGQPDVLEMVHKNQFVTSSSQLLRMALRGANNDATSSWYNAIQTTLLDFAEIS